MANEEKKTTPAVTNPAASGAQQAAKPQAVEPKAAEQAADRKEAQKLMVKKKDKALQAAMAVFTLVMAGIGIAGVMLIKPDKVITQGQADCDNVRVSGKLPGRIVKFYVEEGDYVHKGDTLVSISSKTADASLYRAKKMHSAAMQTSKKVDNGTRYELKDASNNVVEQANAAEVIAKKTYDRMENLYKEGVVTEQKRDEAKAAYDAASAAVRTAQSNQQLAQNGSQAEDKAATQNLAEAAQGTVMEVESLLEDQYLIAPCDGEVSEIYPHEGELVALGTPVMSISKLSDMWVEFNVREEQLNLMPMDTLLSVTIPALNNKQTNMRVYYIQDVGSYATWTATKAYGQYDSKTFKVKCRPTEELRNFRPGMSVLLNEKEEKD